MIDYGKKNLLGVYIDAIDYAAATDKIICAARQQRSLTVTALAVHGVMTGVLDPVHRYRLNHVDLVVPDGQPVRWALNLLYHTRLPDRVYGPHLMWLVCQRAAAHQLGIYLYGSRATVIDRLAHALTTQIPDLRIAGLRPSCFRQVTAEEQQQISTEIQQAGAALAFVGLGCPRQEVWLYEHRHMLTMPLIAVGAAFDFHAGSLPQAPSALQRAGLEWLFRLVQEPRRLWKRYLFLNPTYLALLALQASHLKQFDPTLAQIPLHDERYG